MNIIRKIFNSRTSKRDGNFFVHLTKIIGFSPNDEKIYREAFTHRSMNIKNDNGEIVNYERLEFLGDGVLECITKYYLYRRFPKENEGFMTEKKIALVKNEAIGKLAYEMGLHKWYVISKHAEEKKTRTNLKKLGCLFEAFLGALFLDFNKHLIKHY